MIVDMLKLYLQLWHNVQIKLQFILARPTADFWSVFSSTPLIRFEKHYLQLKLLLEIFKMGIDKVSLFPMSLTEKLPWRLRVLLQVSTGTQVIYELW